MAKAINVSEQRQRVINPSPALGSWLRRIAFFILLLALWQVLAMIGVWPDYLFPGPLAVFGALVAGFQGGQFLQASMVSLQRLAIGYSISLVIGVVLGLLIGRVRLLEETVGSLILGLQALPSVCWLRPGRSVTRARSTRHWGCWWRSRPPRLTRCKPSSCSACADRSH